MLSLEPLAITEGNLFFVHPDVDSWREVPMRLLLFPSVRVRDARRMLPFAFLPLLLPGSALAQCLQSI